MHNERGSGAKDAAVERSKVEIDVNAVPDGANSKGASVEERL
jgi:hypothetical protein